MGSRVNLQTELEAVLGSRNVYFQPPETLKIQYPCIIYELSNIQTVKANNRIYINKHRYQLTIIHSDPDNTLKDGILFAFRYCSFDRVYKADNLYHYVYNLYY